MQTCGDGSVASCGDQSGSYKLRALRLADRQCVYPKGTLFATFQRRLPFALDVSSVMGAARVHAARQ
jgi:hypothetical protein